MLIDKPHPRRKPLSMTSLIDVIFLLLLFFMLSSTFTRFGSVDFGGTGKAGSSGVAAAPDILVIVTGEGLRINGEYVGPDAVDARLTEFLAKGAKSAMILPREGANAQALVDAVEALRRSAQLSGTDLTLTVAR